MTVIHISLLLIVFIGGFQLGKTYIIKGLALRVMQLYEEDDHQKAKLIETILSKKRDG